jgi:D-alanine-D-alanine ligase
MISLTNLKIWVLVPHLETDDANLQYYYDFSQSHEEYKNVFSELEADWIWQPVTMQNFRSIIASIRRKSAGKTPVVLNLCDGDEINGTPGVSVIHALDEQELIYTGSSSYFYNITTSKIPMKQAFDAADVSTAKWEVITDEAELAGIFKRLGSPLIIKPAVSGGSMGVSIKNVVKNEDELRGRLKEIQNGYHGWDLNSGGLFVEQYIAGREFTTFVIGAAKRIRQCKVFEPIERVFHPSLPEEEKFLSFDRLWEIYENESPMPGDENFYEYKAVEDEQVAEQLKKISLEAYASVKGTGYTRIDFRMDEAGNLFVLEVNAQCGLSEDENYTSIGAILKVSSKTFTHVVVGVLEEAFRQKDAALLKQLKRRKAA